MSPEAQRIAIGAACPELFEIHGAYCGTGENRHIEKLLTRRGEGITGAEIDPLSDLNAMHEAEARLSLEQWLDYERKLCAVCKASKSHEPIHATAAQRAEAFLRTLSLWDDSK